MDQAASNHAADTATGARREIAGVALPGTRFLLAANPAPGGGGQVYAISAAGHLSAVAGAGADTGKAPAAAKPQHANPALAGQLPFKFMGDWRSDTAELEKDPEFLKHKAAVPQSIPGLLDLMRGMRMQVTLDGIRMTVMDQKSFGFKSNL